MGQRLTVQLLLDLEGDCLAGHLQQVDGFTQRFALQTHAVDGQDPVTHVDRPGPGRTPQTDCSSPSVRGMGTGQPAL